MPRLIHFIVIIFTLTLSVDILPSFDMATANVILLKQLDTASISMQLYYPLGACDDSLLPHVVIPDTSILNHVSPYLAGVVAIQNSNWIQAEQYIDKALATETTFDMSIYAMGVIQIMLGQDPSVYWRQGNSTNRLLLIGDKCIVSGNKDRAGDYYRAALQAFKYQDQVSLAHIEKLIEYFAGVSDEESYRSALDLYMAFADPTTLDFHWTLGKVYARHSDSKLALEHLQYIATVTPSDSAVWLEIGRVYLQMQEYDAGRTAITKALSLSPKSSEYYVWMGNSYLYQQEYTRSAVWYEQALEVNPEDRKAVENLARMRMDEKRYQEAHELLIHLMTLDDRAYARSLAADAARNLQDWTTALKYIKEALTLEPNNVFYFEQLAEICEGMSDITCLQNAYQNILRLNPSDISAQQKLDELDGIVP